MILFSIKSHHLDGQMQTWQPNQSWYILRVKGKGSNACETQKTRKRERQEKENVKNIKFTTLTYLKLYRNYLGPQPNPPLIHPRRNCHDCMPLVPKCIQLCLIRHQIVLAP